MSDPFFHPISGQDLPRFAGVPSFMRLPHLAPGDARRTEVEIGLIGVPWDGGTTNRPGPRHGPRQLRDYSTMMRRVNPASKIDPFALANCADLGDVNPNPVDLDDTLGRIETFYAGVAAEGIVPMSAGGDHLTSLPVLRALSKAHGSPLGMVHFDAHTDLYDSYFGGYRYTHGTPFRRAIEEGVLDPERVVQIGIRGPMYDGEDIEWGRARGVRIIPIEEFFELGVVEVMRIAREVIGNRPTYCSFDIDFIDPAYAPGTGTPEVGGPTSYQAQHCVRLLEGANLIGADLVEVSPPFDPSGGTAWLGVNIMFEIMCVLAKALDARR
ncbi:agmatinase [Roseobacter sp. HKCCA0434]|uniref:agmatinase n=1 Tax=Roseobacter sp. HKCCA0434 TaxID=3079297 RepID=UPI002905C75F|nr:agmatinase [Roseobacter sp. HKCCA0434]